MARYRAEWPAASPALAADGTLVVGYPGGLARVGVDGELRWRHATATGHAVFPFVAGDGLCLLTGFGYLECLDANGKRSTSIGGMAGDKDIVGNPALGHGGHVYVPGAGALWAFGPPPEAKSAWVCRLDSRKRWFGVAVGADDTVYAATHDGILRALAPDGQARWTLPVRARAAPAIGGTGTLYVGDAEGALRALSPEGRLLWSYSAGGAVTAPPVIGPDGTVYVGSDDGKLHAVSPIGTARWAFETEGPIRSAAAVARDGTVYVGSNDGRLYALRADGTEKWSFATGGAVHAPAILLDGTVVVTSGDGAVRAVRDPGSGGLADSPWPKWARDVANTARAPRPPAAAP